MKYRKIAVITTIVLASGLGTTAVLANGTHAPEIVPKPVAATTTKVTTPVQQSTTLPPQTAQTAPTQAVQAAPAAQQPSQPTPSQNKDKIMQLISDYATNKWGASTAYAETTCFDNYLTTTPYYQGGGVGYEDYDTALNTPLLQLYLSGEMYFDGAVSCHIVFLKT